MRGIALLIVFFVALIFVFTKPYVGIYLFSWISYMNPHRLTWGFTYSFDFAMIAALVTMAAWVYSKEPKKPPISRITVLLAIFILWISITTALAIVPDIAYDRWVTAIKILVMTVLTMILINTEKRLNILIAVITFSIGYYAVKGGVFMILSGGNWRVYGPAQSYITENNGLAAATLMIIPLAYYLWSLVTDKRLKFVLLLAFPLMLASVLASYSRGGFLSMGAMLIFLWWKSKNKLVTGVLGAVTIALLLSFMPQKYIDRLSTIKTYEQDQSASARLDVWTYAWNLALDNPIFGGGFANFASEQTWQKYKTNTDRGQKNFHSIYFETLASHGFVGLFLYLSIYIASFLECQKIRRRSRNHKNLLWAYRLSGMLQVSFVAFSVSGTFLNLALFDLPWHLVACVVILSEITRNRTSAENLPENVAAKIPRPEY